MSELAQLNESVRVVFRWTASGVITDPSPAPTATITAPDGTASALSLIKQGSGATTRYIADVTEAAAGLYEILASTSDASVDAAEFQEFVRIGQGWIEDVGGGGGSGSDPLTNTAADYSGDQLGAKIGLIGTVGATVPTDDVDTEGEMTFYLGADYHIADGTAKEINDDYASSLSSATAQLVFGDYSLTAAISGSAGAYVYQIECSQAEGEAIGTGYFTGYLLVTLSSGRTLPPRAVLTVNFVNAA